jgi:hypothetical protein
MMRTETRLAKPRRAEREGRVLEEGCGKDSTQQNEM